MNQKCLVCTPFDFSPPENICKTLLPALCLDCTQISDLS